jgi:uncharacterized membrane protein
MSQPGKITPRGPAQQPAPVSGVEEPVSNLVEQNIQAIAELDARADRVISGHQRALEACTAALSQPAFFLGIVGGGGGWILVNTVGARLLGFPPFDPPPFFWLQGGVGLCALLTTTMVLITQNRQGKMAERRAQLELHVNLLAEQKIAKLIGLVEELRRDLPHVSDRRDEQAEAMQESVDPHAVITALDLTMGASGEDLNPSRADGLTPPGEQSNVKGAE